MTDDPFEGPGWLDYADHVRKELIPKIKGSAITMSLVSGSDPDPKIAMETGYMILMDKPIIAVVLPGVKVPRKLAMVADEIVEADFDKPEETSKRIAEAVRRLEAKSDRH
jgi:nucleoside 2-deoxyribosyltransferase